MKDKMIKFTDKTAKSSFRLISSAIFRLLVANKWQKKQEIITNDTRYKHQLRFWYHFIPILLNFLICYLLSLKFKWNLF